jgi:hypothetical protein
MGGVGATADAAGCRRYTTPAWWCNAWCLTLVPGGLWLLPGCGAWWHLHGVQLTLHTRQVASKACHALPHGLLAY